MNTPTAPTRESFAVAGGTGLPVPTRRIPIRQRDWRSTAPAFLQRDPAELAVLDSGHQPACTAIRTSTRTPIDEAKVAALYKAGATIRDLARNHRTAERHIRAAIEDNGVTLRPKNQRNGMPDIEAICNDYANGISVARLSRKHKRSKQTITKILNEAGVLRPKGVTFRSQQVGA